MLNDVVLASLGAAGFIGTLIIAPWSFGTKAAIVLVVVIVPALVGAVAGYVSTRRWDRGVRHGR